MSSEYKFRVNIMAIDTLSFISRPSQKTYNFSKFFKKTFKNISKP